MLKHVELFCGMGGNRLGLGQSVETIAAVDYEPRVCNTYSLNFAPPNVVCARVEDFSPPRCDIVTAGPPCQPASRAGRKLGMADDRWKTSLDALVRAIKETKCKHVIFENVKDFPRYTEARNVILDGLSNLGFECNAGYLHAIDLGLPQKRTRYFIVASRDEKPNFPNKKVPSSGIGSILESNVENLYPDKNFYLTDRRINGLQEHARRHKAMGHGFGFRILKNDEFAFTVVVGGMGLERNIVEDPGTKRIRFLTPREMARLQGFPDSYILPDGKTLAYSQLAEAVPPQMIGAILEANPSWK